MADQRTTLGDIAATLRDINDSGQPKHLLLAGPASLGALVGAAANANGP